MLLMKFANDYADGYMCGTRIMGYSMRELYDKVSIYIVPMVNPDGVDIVLNGLCRSNPNYCNLIRWNNENLDFSRTWQANNNGVDLNHNYNAQWEMSKAAEPSYGILGPGPTRFSGKFAESEAESHAIANFTRRCDFQMVIAFHSQGQVIYWQYGDKEPPNSKKLGELFEQKSGYQLDTTEGIASFSGYKDWFIQEFNRPGYTVEVGLGKNPLPLLQFEEIYRDTLPIMLCGAQFFT